MPGLSDYKSNVLNIYTENMNPIIKTIPEKEFIGMRTTISLSDNHSQDLWKSFMPRRKEIRNNLTAELYSIQVYDKTLELKKFNPETLFETWAAIEVADLNVIPDGMESYLLEGGLYAVFVYKGTPDAFSEMLRYIFGNWLPGSNYALDDRAHFEIMGEKYKNNDPDSEEEVWIPIKKKDGH